MDEYNKQKKLIWLTWQWALDTNSFSLDVFLEVIDQQGSLLVTPSKIRSLYHRQFIPVTNRSYLNHMLAVWSIRYRTYLRKKSRTTFRVTTWTHQLMQIKVINI